MLLFFVQSFLFFTTETKAVKERTRQIVRLVERFEDNIVVCMEYLYVFIENYHLLLMPFPVHFILNSAYSIIIRGLLLEQYGWLKAIVIF
jgi:hypothetical protein